MRNKQSIFDLFKSSESLLDQAPGPKAWNRLERKLDLHYRRKKSHQFKWLGMAAALTLLIATTFLLPFFQNQHHAKKLADNTSLAEPLAVETNDAETIRVAAISNQLSSKQRGVVKEGQPGKKLIVSREAAQSLGSE